MNGIENMDTMRFIVTALFVETRSIYAASRFLSRNTNMANATAHSHCLNVSCREEAIIMRSYINNNGGQTA